MSRISKNKLKTRRNKKQKRLKKKNFLNYNRKSARGYYKGLLYESCLELATILHCEKLGLKIERPNIDPPITYVSPYDKKIHRYYPDFIVEDFLILEIKGFIPKKQMMKIFVKQNALEVHCKRNGLWCMMVFSETLDQNLVRRARKLHKELKNAKHK